MSLLFAYGDGVCVYEEVAYEATDGPNQIPLFVDKWVREKEISGEVSRGVETQKSNN